MAKFHYETCCVASDGPSITAMVDRARDISLRTFRKHCDSADWERSMGYAVGAERGLHMSGDYHVTYHKSRFRGRPCYYIRHSAIEHVFTARGGE